MVKKFLLLSLILIILIGGGFFFWKKTFSPDRQSKKDFEQIGPIFPLEAFIVNLADSDGRRYLKVTMELELSDKRLTEELKKRLPQIRDSILMILTTKRFEDIHRAEGKIALRNEIISKLNSLLKKGSITNLYFTEFVIQ
jgi:flagellar FliL protein